MARSRSGHALHRSDVEATLRKIAGCHIDRGHQCFRRSRPRYDGRQCEGATLVTGGPGRPEGLNRGYYIRPTIFGHVTPEMTIAREEIFGPVLSIISYKDEEDAVRIANDTVYGLAAGLWTANLDRAMITARQLRAGLVWVNGWDSCDITMPFGGFKQSGFGRDRSLHALHKYADLKAVTFTLRENNP